MKKLQCLMLTMLFFFMTGFSFFKKPPVPLEGIYDLKLKTLTVFDLSSKDIMLNSVIAELTESKPEGLRVNVDLKQMTEPTFGCFKLGNVNQKIWFLMGRDAQGFWSEVYLDQNGDGQIDPKEQIKSLQKYQSKERKLKRDSTYTLIPIPIRVKIKGIDREIYKRLYYFFNADIFTNQKESITVVSVFNGSFLEGEMKVALGKETKLVKFRIFDVDGNGCYNDFGEDLLYLDTNYDGLFKKNESQKLTEFFDFGSAKTRKQYRLLLPPQPTKLAIVDALTEFDRSLLEASSDPVEDGTADETE